MKKVYLDKSGFVSITTASGKKTTLVCPHTEGACNNDCAWFGRIKPSSTSGIVGCKGDPIGELVDAPKSEKSCLANIDNKPPSGAAGPSAPAEPPSFGEYEIILRRSILNEDEREKIRKIIIGALKAKDVLNEAVSISKAYEGAHYWRAVVDNAHNLLTEACE